MTPRALRPDQARNYLGASAAGFKRACRDDQGCFAAHVPCHDGALPGRQRRRTARGAGEVDGLRVLQRWYWWLREKFVGGKKVTCVGWDFGNGEDEPVVMVVCNHERDGSIIVVDELRGDAAREALGRLME